MINYAILDIPNNWKITSQDFIRTDEQNAHVLYGIINNNIFFQLIMPTEYKITFNKFIKKAEIYFEIIDIDSNIYFSTLTNMYYCYKPITISLKHKCIIGIICKTVNKLKEYIVEFDKNFGYHLPQQPLLRKTGSSNFDHFPIGQS